MAQQRRVKPAVGMAAVGLGLGVGALGLDRPAPAAPPKAVQPVAATPAGLLAEGRELLKQNRLGDALAKADAAAKLGGTTPGADTPDELRRDVVADGKKQIEELTAQAKVLAGRGDAVREKASLELARQIAAEIGQPTAPPANVIAQAAAQAPAVPTLPPVEQAIVFHPAEPAALPSVQPPSLPALPSLPQVATPPAAEPEKPLLPEPPALSLTPSGPTIPLAVPVPAEPSPAPGATAVTLPKLAAAVGAALAAAPAPAQDAAAKPGPGPDSIVAPLSAPLAQQAPAPSPATGTMTKEQYDALRADLDGLKDYKKQVQDLLQGKADGAGKSVLDAGLLKRMTDLEDKLDRIEKLVESLARGTVTQSALKPSAPAPMPALTTKSAVKLVNDYPSDLSIILNGTSHRLKPGEAKAVDVPPGSFTYELVADGAKPITRLIRDDETVTLRIK